METTPLQTYHMILEEIEDQANKYQDYARTWNFDSDWISKDHYKLGAYEAIISILLANVDEQTLISFWEMYGRDVK